MPDHAPVSSQRRRTSRSHAFVWAADLALLLSLLLLWAAWILDPVRLGRASISWSAKPFLAFALTAAVAIALHRRNAKTQGIWGRTAGQRLLLILLPPMLLLGGLDLAFLAVNVPAPAPPMVIRGKDITGDVAAPADPFFRYSPELIWEFVPGAPFFGKTINSQGFVGREFTPGKPEDVVRVICIGDSCTGMGPPTYADCLHARLEAAPPTGQRWEAFNMGVHGYSSVQGLQLFRQKARSLQPDFVTIYFGWNDHWLANGPEDHERLRRSAGPLQAAIHQTLQKKRSFRGLQMLLRKGAPSGPDRPLSGQGEGVALGADAVQEALRVPPARYRQTLTRLIHEVREVGARPILITAPRSELGRHLVHIKATSDPRRAEELHDQYIAMTRAVAAETATPLLDLAGMIDPLPFPEFFTEDGIHLTLQAREWIGDRLYDRILELMSVPTSEPDEEKPR